jgi:hypothetical protein
VPEECEFLNVNEDDQIIDLLGLHKDDEDDTIEEISNEFQHKLLIQTDDEIQYKNEEMRKNLSEYLKDKLF